MSISRQQRPAIPHHGLHLVPSTGRQAEHFGRVLIYKIATVAAALFLAMTVC